MKRVAIVPLCYLPSKGYFDVLHDVELALVDAGAHYVQTDTPFQARIHGRFGAESLVVPRMAQHADAGGAIDRSWARAHWRRIVTCYSDAAHFHHYRDDFAGLYAGREWGNAASLATRLMASIARDMLGLTTAFTPLSDFLSPTEAAPPLEALLARCEADELVIDATTFAEGVQVGDVPVVRKDLTGYPAYPQCGSRSCDGLSILDVLFHTGPMAPWYIWGWRQVSRPTKVA